ncbi:hypothetical protein HWV62_26895 [Athelia sp. TMB]|nr:hypothetical protein HWV62_26895 [Athelia sp. TMB]
MTTTGITKKPWCPAIDFNFSWYRRTYYGHPSWLQDREKARQTIDTILNEGKRFPKKDIQPVILLAFGLMLRDITAVNLVKAGGSPDPPYVDQMALEEDDMLAINDALADYLEWSGNSGAVTDKRQSKRTAKAERSGSN